MVEIVVPEAAPAEVWGPEITLPSGRKAQFRTGKGRDIRLAMAAVGTPFDYGRYRFALLARKAKIDGKAITLEQVDELPEEDVEMLMVEVSGKSPSREEPGANAS